MTKNRLEAFSDGVFAIVITLLVLDIRLPEVEYDHLPQALLHLLPNLIAYVMSFSVIGLYWVSHHQSGRFVAVIDRPFLWMNVLLLLFVSFLPFPTSLLGHYPFKTLPTIIYGANLIAANFIGYLMIVYLKRHPHLASEALTEQMYRRQRLVYAIVNGVYLAAIGLAFVWPEVSYLIFGAVFVILIGYNSHGKSMRGNHAETDRQEAHGNPKNS